jgi:hypothetical protein
LGAKVYWNIRKRHISHLPTTQGTYIVTASGILIDSGHTHTPDELVTFLADGLKKYNSLSRKERLGRSIGTSPKGSRSNYPKDGLVLKVTLRKLYSPRPTGRRARGVIECNQDFAWFRKHEAEQFLSVNPKQGETHDIPKSLMMRLAKYHFLDTVRTFCDPYPDRCVKTAKLTSTVLSVNGNLVSMRFNGAVHSSQDDTPRWGIVREARIPRRPERSFDATLLGYATYDMSQQKFIKFELVALGTQSGGGTHLLAGPVTMGVVLSMAGNNPIDRVEPRHLRLYPWK